MANLRIRQIDLRLFDLQTRLPFKYGIATMTRVPQLFLRLDLDISGDHRAGVSADLLPPKWFTKDPAKPLAAELEEMIEVIGHAAEAARGLEGDNPFAIWRQLYQRQAEWGRQKNYPPLLAHFGTSLVERALIEAMARHFQKPFAQLVLENRLGISLGEIHPELMGRTPSEFLPDSPLEKIIARHTVGLADALEESDIAAGERLEDGLPQSLERCLEVYGLRHFKIKIHGQPDDDLARLTRAARVIERLAPPDFAFSLDANEQFHSLADFRAFWARVERQGALRDFLTHLLFIEQPLDRHAALRPGVAQEFAAWPDRPPVIIDESDGELESLPIALHLGYAGTTHKNCKGIFKGIANRCLIGLRQKQDPARTWLMSGEDLCNIGPVALLQDLAAMALLGIHSVERNGHHYCRGLSFFPKPVQEAILRHHPDLYRRTTGGWPTLRIERGRIALGSVNRAPFGVGFLLDTAQFATVAEWRRQSSGPPGPG